MSNVLATLDAHENQWIIYKQVPMPQDRKTAVVDVVNRNSDVPIGRLAWYGAWRQYTFFPGPDTTFNSDCLNDIAGACATLTEKQRALWAGQKRTSADRSLDPDR